MSAHNRWRVFSAACIPAAIACLCLWTSLLQGQDQDQDPDQSLQAPFLRPPGLELEEGDLVTFVGDSITHQCLYTQYYENYFYTRHPELRLRFHNAGVSGDTVSDVLERFEDDVARFEPRYVFVLLGMNDGGYASIGSANFDTYAAGMEALLARIESIGATPVVLSPTFFDHHQLNRRMADPDYRFRDRSFAPDYDAVLAYFGSWLRQQAGAKGLPFVNMSGPLSFLTIRQRRVDPDFTLVPDAIHPGAAGHLIMAANLVKQLPQTRRDVALVHVAERKQGWEEGSGNGKIDAIQFDASTTTLTFTHLARSLPWEVPPEAATVETKWDLEPSIAIGKDLLYYAGRMNPELLRVSALPPGQYEVFINEQKLSKHTNHAILATGFKLHEEPDTPQRQQALEVARLNQLRNDEAVRPLRDIWARIKGLRRRHEEDPAAFEAAYAKLKPEIDALLERAARYQAEIHEASQPKPAQYRIAPWVEESSSGDKAPQP